WADLLDHRERHQLACERNRAKLLQSRRSLQCEHRADGESGENHNRKRSHPDKVHLLQHVGEISRTAKEIRYCFRGEQRVFLNRKNLLFDNLVRRGEQSLQKWHVLGRLQTTGYRESRE